MVRCLWQTATCRLLPLGLRLQTINDNEQAGEGACMEKGMRRTSGHVKRQEIRGKRSAARDPRVGTAENNSGF